MRLCTKSALLALWCHDSRREAYREYDQYSSRRSSGRPWFNLRLINYIGFPLKF